MKSFESLSQFRLRVEALAVQQMNICAQQHLCRTIIRSVVCLQCNVAGRVQGLFSLMNYIKAKP